MAEPRWTKERLCRLVREKLADRLFIVVSNREPFSHDFSGNKITWKNTVGGLTEALDPVLRASGGTWIARGAGAADRQAVDSKDRIAVPPDRPEYTLRRVWLTEEEVKGYYDGFANQGLWPLYHKTYVKPEFQEKEWQTYQKVNQIFAEAVLQETGGRQAIVFVQDYHFARLSQFLKERAPDLIAGQFWHIPWPGYEVLRQCPWHKEIIQGLLGNDLLGFHIRSYGRNFMASAGHLPGAKINDKKSTIEYAGHITHIGAFPISVDFKAIAEQAGTDEVKREMEDLRREFDLEGKYVGIGMDRLDYTKGIPERLRALDRFFEENPRYRGRVVYIMAGMPSRTDIGAYGELTQRVDALTNGINARYGTASWKPVIPMMRQLTPVELNALRRLAHFCLVSSLHDGMNLVSKEYVAARIDGDGVLILSKFTGAAEELKDAWLIDPHDIGGLAAAIKEAIEMPEAEKKRLMANMRKTVAANNIYRWGASILSRLTSIAEE
jgi:trehalose 6-phosphate synthase